MSQVSKYGMWGKAWNEKFGGEKWIPQLAVLVYVDNIGKYL